MQTWLEMGFRHIADWNGYDHMLFLVALSAVHSIREWRQILWLVTAFTVGHSLSLAMATFEWVAIDPDWVEWLIPVTILLTCTLNVISGKHAFLWRGIPLQYPIALAFGLIHGLGFSNFLHEMAHSKADFATMLLGFNLGLEVGQIIIVAGAVAAGFIAMEGFRLSKTVWNWIISGITAGFAIYLLIQKSWL